MKKLLALVLASTTMSLVSLPQVYAQDDSAPAAAATDEDPAVTAAAEAFLATLTPEQRLAFAGWSPSAIASVAASSNPAAIVAAAVNVRTQVLANNLPALAAAMASLTGALGASGLGDSAVVQIAAGISANIEAAVSGLPANSPIRSAANAAITGAGLIAADAGASDTQLASIGTAATSALASAPTVSLGAVGGDTNGSPVTQ